ncbi:hypothetical protein [Ferrimonas balearica]|uniref:capsular polysaccharide export protein, LipB/KpsS family n=1 Tax=Ferrimonas balearica TaxID=44012 RepID=UPI001C99C4D9|nr:hypothetical protein [Ferrimonas balearica]MBY5923317.1 hypothetical protein [Ferrimonas balearica]MBY5995275.1 hypothetical protein [Ferrimonas balearica]
MTPILAHVDCLERFHFFVRLQQALPDSRWQLLTSRLSLLRKAREAGIPCHWLRRGAPEATLDPKPEPGLEAALGWRHPGHWRRLQDATWQALSEHATSDTLLLVWNGCRTVERTITAYARCHGNRILYLELGNFPGRLFADPEGVNARSRLAREPEQLDHLPDPEAAFQSWREAYLSRAQQPPQSAQVRRVNPDWWQDQLGYLLGGLSADEPLWRRAQRKWRARRQPALAGNLIPSVPFLLYPMQVSSDSQLLFNSDVDNREALMLAAKHAEAQGLTLCIKPHPAEPDTRILEWLRSESLARGWLLTQAPMPQLLPHARAVVTINSTVGLEAMLLDKPLQVLGRCHYSAFTPKRLRQYLMSYLHPIDYFAQTPISSAEANALIACAREAR